MPKTAGQFCASAGITVAELSEHFGKNKQGFPLVSRQTLGNWAKDKPMLLETVIKGYKAR